MRLKDTTPTEEIRAFSVNVGDLISINNVDYLSVWSLASLMNGRNVGIRFVERDANGRRLYVNLRVRNFVRRAVQS